MSIYKALEGKNGNLRYWKDRRFIKKEDVPEEILEILTPGHDVDTEAGPVLAPKKQCIFCGEDTNWVRVLNGQTIYICETDYYDKTMGQIAQRVNQLKAPKEEPVVS